MQIVKINEKDIIDTIMLLREHAIAADDDDHVNAARIAELCAGEWGLWRTTSMNLEKVRDYLPHFDLSDEDRTVVAQRVDELLSRHGRLSQGHEVAPAGQGRRQGQMVQGDRLGHGTT